MMKRKLFSLKGWLMIAATLALTALSFATPAFAQQPTGAIEGTITDQSGAVLASAKISITEKATGRVIEVATNSGGYFVARALLPGAYNVKVEHSGFSAGRVENVVVQTGQVSNVSVGLKVGATTEVVQVEGTSAQLQVDTSRQTIDGVVTAQQIAQLPLNQRNFLDLAALQPSVIVRDGEAIDPTKVGAYRAATVNGSSGTGTRVQIDGIDVTDETVGTTSANISTDAVQEFQLSRANFDLSTSLTTSGAINIVSRGGSNEFHGAGFYFWRSDRLAARQDFLADKPPFRRQQVGYSVGGPIVKDKLFFFSNWERTYQSTQNVVTSGDFPNIVDGTVSLPVGIRYTTHRLDWNATGKLRIFYRHSYDDNLATGGGGASPFQNVDWTNVHAIGADISGSRTTHSFRFGYVNFNNRIESQELDPFNFNRTPQGIAFQLNVGDLSLGPNGLAPQQTYQDNFQSKYDGSLVKGNHTFRYGADINRVILGGFANFAGPLTINGLFNSTVKAGLPAAQQGNPLAYPLDSFSTGPNSGFFTNESAHNLPHGGHRNTRYAGYVGDSWRIKRNFTLNIGTRWEYDTGFFTGKAPRLPILDVYGPKTGDVAKFPKDAFSPQVGFAWDIFGNGKTSIRGGFYRSYEMNIFNNTLFDEFARLPTGIGPTALPFDGVVGPDGRAINIGAVPGCAAADVAAGDYSCLIGRPISSVAGFLGQIHQAVQSAYSSFKFDPTKGITEFENNGGVTFGGQFPGTYKIPYSMQFTIGVQRELWPNQVLTVDYVRNRGVGLPFLMGEFERRRAARTLNAAAARSQVTGFLTDSCQGRSISQAISIGCLDENGDTFFPTIADFGLASDSVFRGLTPNITRARLLTGGFSLYQGLQARLEGRFGKVSDSPYNPVRGLSYTISYALGRAEATGGSNRTEFINNTIDNDNWNSTFGASGNDRTHIFGLGALMEVPFGFRLNQIWTFRTATPQNLTIPFLDSFAGSNGIFTTDINGDGGIGSGAPRGDLLPGTQVGDLGRKIKSFSELNKIITAFNSNFAGKLTPAGQALVNAGVFTEAQLRALGGVVKPIPLAPVNNPWPFENHLNLDLRITRPIAITERFKVEPSADIFNLFNNNSLGQYGPGLDGSTGSLNFDYTKQVDRAVLNRTIRHRQKNTRLIQLGVRVTF
jgi:Carboxypeptidase regulatory-like domain